MDVPSELIKFLGDLLLVQTPKTPKEKPKSLAEQSNSTNETNKNEQSETIITSTPSITSTPTTITNQQQLNEFKLNENENQWISKLFKRINEIVRHYITIQVKIVNEKSNLKNPIFQQKVNEEEVRNQSIEQFKLIFMEFKKIMLMKNEQFSIPTDFSIPSLAELKKSKHSFKSSLTKKTTNTDNSGDENNNEHSILKLERVFMLGCFSFDNRTGKHGHIRFEDESGSVWCDLMDPDSFLLHYAHTMSKSNDHLTTTNTTNTNNQQQQSSDSNSKENVEIVSEEKEKEREQMTPTTTTTTTTTTSSVLGKRTRLFSESSNLIDTSSPITLTLLQTFNFLCGPCQFSKEEITNIQDKSISKQQPQPKLKKQIRASLEIKKYVILSGKEEISAASLWANSTFGLNTPHSVSVVRARMETPTKRRRLLPGQAFSIQGQVVAFSPLICLDSNQRFFFVELSNVESSVASPVTSTCVLLFLSDVSYWHPSMRFEKFLTVSNVRHAQIRSKRLFVTTENSSIAVSDESLLIRKQPPSVVKTPQQRNAQSLSSELEQSNSGNNDENSSDPLQQLQQFQQEPSTVQKPTNIKPHSQQTITYKGTITNLLRDGVLEIDKQSRVYLSHHFISSGSRSFRIGSEIILENVHPFIEKITDPQTNAPKSNLVGFACCSYSSVRVSKFSQLDSQIMDLHQLSSLDKSFWNKHSIPVLRKLEPLQETINTSILPVIQTESLSAVTLSELPNNLFKNILSSMSELDLTTDLDVYEQFFNHQQSQDPCQIMYSPQFELPVLWSVKHLQDMIIAKSGSTVYAQDFLSSKELGNVFICGYFRGNQNGRIEFCDGSGFVEVCFPNSLSFHFVHTNRLYLMRDFQLCFDHLLEQSHLHYISHTFNELYFMGIDVPLRTNLFLSTKPGLEKKLMNSSSSTPFQITVYLLQKTLAKKRNKECVLRGILLAKNGVMCALPFRQRISISLDENLIRFYMFLQLNFVYTFAVLPNNQQQAELISFRANSNTLNPIQAVRFFSNTVDLNANQFSVDGIQTSETITQKQKQQQQQQQNQIPSASSKYFPWQSCTWKFTKFSQQMSNPPNQNLTITDVPVDSDMINELQQLNEISMWDLPHNESEEGSIISVHYEHSHAKFKLVYELKLNTNQNQQVHSKYSTKRIYLDFGDAIIPLGLVPGTKVRFGNLEQKISKQGNVYNVISPDTSIQIFPTETSTTVNPPSNENYLIRNAISSQITSTPEMHEKSESLFISQINNWRKRELRPRWLRIAATPVVIQSFLFRWHCRNCLTILNFEDKNTPCKKCRLIKNKVLTAELSLDVEDGTGKFSLLFMRPQLIWNLFNLSEKSREMVEAEAGKRPLGLCYRTLDNFDIDFEKIAELDDEALKMLVCDQSLYERRLSFICTPVENLTQNVLTVEHVEPFPIHQEAYRMLSLLNNKKPNNKK